MNAGTEPHIGDLQIQIDDRHQQIGDTQRYIVHPVHHNNDFDKKIFLCADLQRS